MQHYSPNITSDNYMLHQRYETTPVISLVVSWSVTSCDSTTWGIISCQSTNSMLLHIGVVMGVAKVNVQLGVADSLCTTITLVA